MKCFRDCPLEATYTAIIHNGDSAQAWALCGLCAREVLKLIVPDAPPPPDTEPNNEIPSRDG